jgi:two-component system, NtrC family, sensor kinase
MSTHTTDANFRIIVIDDNRAIHEDFRKILANTNEKSAALDRAADALFDATSSSPSHLQFQIDSASQGQEGYDLTRRAVEVGQPYALAFVDVRMPPGWDGIETIIKLWEVDPDLQIVICTAYSDYSWDEMIAKIGHSDRLLILKKPFDAIEVIQLAHALTEKWRLLQLNKSKFDDLDRMVSARTAELSSANKQLQIEITERKRLEIELVQAQKMESIGRLAGGVAHDFNNILTVINGYTQLLLTDEDPGTPAFTNLREIEKSAEHAATLTRQLLAFGRKQVLQPKTVSLNRIVLDIEGMLRRLIGENIELAMVLPNDLGLVKADVGQIEQVMINLTVNAQDAMPQGGTLTIETRNALIDASFVGGPAELAPGRYATLIFSDTGTGMPPEVKAKVFEPFFTTKEIGKGTGLGLATCYGVIKQSGGSISVDSEVNHGTTFKIYLPIVTATAEPNVTPAVNTRITHGTETILLVEDDSAVRGLAAKLLRDCGYNLMEADNGKSALAVVEKLNGDKFDLVLTDVIMPEMGGKELVDRLRSSRPGIKVIYASGYAAEAITNHGTLEPNAAFLAKPYTFAALAQKVRDVLDSDSDRDDPTAGLNMVDSTSTKPALSALRIGNPQMNETH